MAGFWQSFKSIAGKPQGSTPCVNRLHDASPRTVNAFLTPEEVELLTGYRKPSKQIAWLVRHGTPHYVNAQGRPAVLRELHALAKREPQLGVVR